MIQTVTTFPVTVIDEPVDPVAAEIEHGDGKYDYLYEESERTLEHNSKIVNTIKAFCWTAVFALLARTVQESPSLHHNHAPNAAAVRGQRDALRNKNRLLPWSEAA